MVSFILVKDGKNVKVIILVLVYINRYWCLENGIDGIIVLDDIF